MMLKIVDISTDLIKEYENNPRFNTEAVEKVAESIKEFGFKVPVIIDKDNTIVTGHTRIKAAQQLGLEEVPCIVADDLSEEQIKAFRLIDNKVSEYSTWDENKLQQELLELQILDFNVESFGFETKEIETYVEDEIELPREDVGTKAHNTYLSFGDIKVQLTEDELELLTNIYEQYVDENGNSFGFASYLLESVGM